MTFLQSFAGLLRPHAVECKVLVKSFGLGFEMPVREALPGVTHWMT